MDTEKLRKLALDVFAQSDTETILDALQRTPKNRLATAELDAFHRYLTDSIQTHDDQITQANEDYKRVDREAEGITRRPSNVGASLERLTSIDVMKNPAKELMTVIKKQEPFIIPSGKTAVSLPPVQFAKESTIPQDVLQLLAGSGKSIDAKRPKLDDQVDTNAPQGWLGIRGNELENQENHADDEAVW